MISGVYQLGVTAEGLTSLGLLQRFAWNSVHWSKLKISLRILAVFFISTHFELIKKHDVSGVFSVLGKDEKKVQDRLFFLSVNLRAIANCMRQRCQSFDAGAHLTLF